MHCVTSLRVARLAGSSSLSEKGSAGSGSTSTCKAIDTFFNKSNHAAAEQCTNVVRRSLRSHRPVRDKKQDVL
jgi:hypothetical protein